MKKITAVMILAFIAFNSILAQMSLTVSVQNEKKPISVGDNFLANGTEWVEIPINNIHIKAIRDFSKSWAKAQNVKWYAEPAGFFAYFSINATQGRTFYDKKGNFVYTIRSYPEAYLSRDIREQVKSTYYMDYHIVWVKEILTHSKTIYLLQLEDETTIKYVRVCEGEIELVNAYNKK